MAARRKTEKTDGAHAFAVVVEKMYAEFKVFGEALAGISARFDAKFEAVDARLDGIDTRLDGIDARLAEVQTDVGLLKVVVLDNSRELRELRQQLDAKVDRAELHAVLERAGLPR